MQGSSVLLNPLEALIAPQDPLWLHTLLAMEKDLVPDSLVYSWT